MKNKIFNIKSALEFEKIALYIFKYQEKNNIIYHKYIKNLGIPVEKIKKISDIPFMPIDFFKSKDVIIKNKKVQKIFHSSGTTGIKKSKHLISDLEIYKKSFFKSFEYFYGDIKNYSFFALLPDISENKNSSLIYMCYNLIKKSQNSESGFYLNDFDLMLKNLKKSKRIGKKIFLMGISFALLDFSERFSIDLKNSIIMETGGMKGKRKELIRSELHNIFKKNFNVENVHSEYGMTELLSQAYSKKNGIFENTNWMKIFIRDIYDPFHFVENGKTGGINIIDLANINSCSFIETKDLGRLYEKNNFEILGRFDNSDIRGCNLIF